MNPPQDYRGKTPPPHSSRGRAMALGQFLSYRGPTFPGMPRESSNRTFLPQGSGAPQLRSMRPLGPTENMNLEQGETTQEEEEPFCKVCYEDSRTKSLMKLQVCGCAGSVAHICYECLRDTITSLIENNQVDENGWPHCPDCGLSYTNIELKPTRDGKTFCVYLSETTDWSFSGIITMFCVPFAGMIIVGLLYKYLPKVEGMPTGPRNFTLILIFSLCGILLAFWVIYFSKRYYKYLHREPTRFEVVPSVPGTALDMEETSL